MLNKLEKLKNVDIFIPLFLYITLLIVKLVFIIDNCSLPQVSDEYIYVRFSRELLLNGEYDSVQYPLLYPLMLMPAFLFENYYVAMKIINSIFSSLVPVTVYVLCRLYIGEKESAICAVFSSIIPFQYITTMTLMSENIYFPMLIFSIYLGLKEYKYEIFEDILFGIMLGLMFLTRHITLVFIPVFIFAWLMKQFHLKNTIKCIALKLIMVIVFLVIVYCPWIIMCVRNSHGLKEIVGFKIASNSNPEQLTFGRLAMTGGFYIGYFSLITAPVLGLMIKSFRGLDFKNLFCAYNRLWVTVCGLVAACFTAVTRHSWRAYYNYPEFEKIKGRYLIYFPTLFVILGAVVLFKQSPKFKSKIYNIILTYILPVIMILVSYLIEIEEVFYPLKSTFIGSIESTDGQKIKYVGIAFVLITAIVIWVHQYIYDYGKVGISKYLYIIFALGIVGVELLGMRSYLQYVNEVNYKQNRTNNRYAIELIESLENRDEDLIYVYSEEKFKDHNFIKRVLEFKMMENVVFTNVISEVKTNVFYIITTEKEKYANYVLENIRVFDWYNNQYYMQKIKVD